MATGDYTIMPSGTNIGLLCFQHQRWNNFELNGKKAQESHLVSNAMSLRGLHYSEAFGMPALYQFVLPVVSFSGARVGGMPLSTKDGAGDGRATWKRPTNETCARVAVDGGWNS